MNLKQIEAFVQVAERQSFSETARFLYLTQPTVSAHIAALEKEMNECLFLRNKKRITLTPKGEELYTYAKQVTLLMEQIESSFLANERRFQAEPTFEHITNLLLNEPIILREKGSGTRNESLKILERLGIPKGELNIAASIENTETIKQSVCRGMGISILSSLAVKKELEEGKLLSFPLGDDTGKRNIYIVYNREFPMSFAAKKFANTMKKLYPECRL